MNGDSGPEDRPVDVTPPLASRADRRACARRRHEGAIKYGHCALCGTKVEQ